ncbi:hypothetical protein LTR02_005816 [Friedmanniomyces endolithicus]|nr:hypothetical protein LTR59_007715 [Friedmanniomyces endolithicus]KAK0805400.1 hypothetical protein LTR75_007349 [Friedmanniomyces endolithicus]KAK0906832.1 hypothetical protein LTR02_005816 [Friedmanniomyces endolithicus]KAK0960671.1 hypothetical protein LTS01_020790 [Friedmanniomyces endolithicus]
MSAVWRGNIVGNDGENVTLSTDTDTSTTLGCANGSLRFLSVVEVSRIPLHLVVGSNLHVTTSRPDTERFFSRYLLASHAHQASQKWWQNARPDSPLGILAAVDDSQLVAREGKPRVTEILFYASKDPQPAQSSQTSPVPLFSVRALLLSSDLLVQVAEPTPPSSPKEYEEETDGIFLPLPTSATVEIINEPPVRKRKSVNETFDDAAERRKKARRKGGEGVAAAAAVKTESSIPSLKHRRTVSISDSQANPSGIRPISRSPSVASSRPATAGAAKHSSLSRVQSISGPSTEDSLEDKNKAIISRVVMAGMRLYGLAQSKKPRLRASSTAPSPAVEGCPEPDVADRQKDEEYKLIYHQVFKGTCFAYREHIIVSLLQPHTEALRGTVDGLLDIYCNDPLKASLPGTADKLTPGGRKAFGAGKPSGSDGDVVGRVQ